ncbi:MAG: metallopeptidase TldD-related protein [Spirochaetia bacterium]|nr:metallopeptidase TldD-related protein [Spirochaetia bacterium]
MKLKEKSLENEIKNALEGIKNKYPNEFYGFSLSRVHSLSLQSLFLGSKESLVSYQNRQSSEETFRVQIYVRYGDPVKMGNFSFVIDPLFPLDEQIEKGFMNARISQNQPWDLVLPSPYREVYTCDPKIETQIENARDSLVREIESAIQELNGVKVNSAELYINFHDMKTESSTGVVMEKKRGDIYFEAAMEKLPGPNTQEVHRYIRGTSLDQMNIKKFLHSMAVETQSLGNTVLPPTRDNAVLLVDGEVISDFIHELIEQIHAENEFQQLPFMKPGDVVYEKKLFSDTDRISIQMDPFIPFLAESSSYTQDGLPAEEASIIEDGTVKNQIVSNRMGQYLGKKSNGICGNFKMKRGALSKAELIESEDECFEILSFSSLLINPRTLTWSSEIKLGRLHRKGREPVMVKGGIASGEIRQNFAGCRLGSEEVIISAVADQWHPAKGYIGPDAMLIRSGVKIAGE